MASNVGRVAFPLRLEKEDKMIDEKVVKQILEEIFSSVEDVETQSAAMLQFLKDKGMANDEELAPYFERAKTSSGVRWVAIRARVDYLLSSVINKEEEEKAESALGEGSRKNAEAEVPRAIAEAFRSGNLGVMDYYKMKNVLADTQMREAVAGSDGGAKS